MASSQFVRGVRWILVLGVVAGFVAILVDRDGANDAVPRGPLSGPSSPLAPPPAGGGGPGPASKPPGSADALADASDPPAAAVLGRPLVVRLLERNTDEFPDSLGSEAGADDAGAVVLDGGTAWIDPAVARSTDADTLARFGVRLKDPSIPLARCGVILVHEIQFVGRGREGARVEVHGIPALPAAISLDVADLGAALTFDPASEHVPFAAVAQRLRVLPAGARLELASFGGDGVRATFAGTSRDVAAGARAVLSNESRRLTVTEKALGIEAVDLGTVRRESVPDEIFAEVRYGEVAFRTELVLWVVGRVRSVALEGPGGGDLK